MKDNWVTFCDGGETNITCPNCDVTIQGMLPSADHHPAHCPSCKALLVVVSATDRSFAIDLGNAPVEIQKFLEWSQSALDELEFVSMIISLEEILGDRAERIRESNQQFCNTLTAQSDPSG